MQNATIEDRKTDILLQKVPDTLITTLLAAAIVVVVFWKYTTTSVLIGWFLVFLVFNGIRFYLLCRYYLNQGMIRDTRHWRRMFTLGALISGSIWGFIGVYTITTQPIHISAFMILVSGYLVIGTVLNYSIYMISFMAFSIPVIAPIAFVLVMQENTVGRIYGFSLIVFYAYAVASALRHRAMTYSYIIYEINNNSLLNKLRKEQGEAKRLNQTLEEDLQKLRKTEEQLRQEKRKAEAMANKMLTISSRDGLTGIANRRHFDEILGKEWNRAVRTQSPISLILCDIDHFKAYNDYYGHQEGDNCLMRVAHVLEEHARRAGDLAARYGGEEFALILPETSLESASMIAEEIREAIANTAILHKASDTDNVITMSFGVATVVPRRELEPRRLIALADKALYQAKQEGRNRVVTSKPGLLSDSDAEGEL